MKPTPRGAAVPSNDSGSRLLVRCAVAVVGALAVLAGVAAASPAGPLTPPADAAVKKAAAPRTVRVDPVQCAAPSTDPAVVVVCRPDQVAKVLIDRGTVVLSGVRHSGALDLRRRSGVTVRGEAGALLDAAGGRYALSLRDVSDVVVESLTLVGGSAQTVWVERTRGVVLRGTTVRGSRGAGVQVRDSQRFVLADSRVEDAASAGVMELKGVTDSTYERLVVTRNGRGPALYNGDGLQLSGTRVQVRDVVAHGNGSSPMYEHGVYVSAAARSVQLTGVTSYDNSGVAVKIGGSGTLEGSTLTDDRIALYCGTTAGPGWTVRDTTLQAPRPSVAEAGCVLRS